MTSKKKHKILFVCLGNICRSPAAQAVMQQIVDEAGPLPISTSTPPGYIPATPGSSPTAGCACTPTGAVTRSTTAHAP